MLVDAVMTCKVVSKGVNNLIYPQNNLNNLIQHCTISICVLKSVFGIGKFFDRSFQGNLTSFAFEPIWKQ